MRILMLTHLFPYPADSGARIRTWHLIKFLAEHHTVTVVSFVRGDAAAGLELMREMGIDVHVVPMAHTRWEDGMHLLRSMRYRQPFLMLRDGSTQMYELIRQVTQDQLFDVLFVDQLNMAQYASAVDVPYKVIDKHNALWLLYQRQARTTASIVERLIFGREWRLLADYEAKMCKTFDDVLVVSQSDLDAHHVIGIDSESITVLPIGVDTDQLRPVDPMPAVPESILHVGTMYWPPNIAGIQWFLDDVWPHVRERLSNVVFDVVGKRPPNQLVEMVEHDDRVNFAGYVEDLQPNYEKAGVFVVPLLAGGGMRVKILTSLANGIPIVTTRLGCEGIELEDGVHACIVDSPRNFANAIERVMTDRSFAAKLVANGRKLVEERYDYRVTSRPLQDLLLQRAQAK